MSSRRWLRLVLMGGIFFVEASRGMALRRSSMAGGRRNSSRSRCGGRSSRKRRRGRSRSRRSRGRSKNWSRPKLEVEVEESK